MSNCKIAGVVLAAGMSTRMGQPKLLLPWGNSTVLQSVIKLIQQFNLEEIIIVTGAFTNDIEELFKGQQLKSVYNPFFENGSMLQSLQIGIGELANDIDAAIVFLGDQPMIKPEWIKRLIESFNCNEPWIIVPSFQNHRGHPWVVPSRFFSILKKMPINLTMNDFLNQFSSDQYFIEFESDEILHDLDTPEDYSRFKP